MATAEGMDIGDALIELNLPAKMRNAFAEHYSKQPEIRFIGGEYCSRCAAKVDSMMLDRHRNWHRNVSCQMWMMGQFVQDHNEDHRAMTQAIGAVIEAMTMVGDDGEGIPSTHPTFEEADMPRLHVHEEGTAHEH
jgi:hypothetical protein